MIDGESHFIRAEKSWNEIHGDTYPLTSVRVIGDYGNRLSLVIPEAKVFWSAKMSAGISRPAYFTAASGDDNAIYDLKVKLRAFSLDPRLVHETKNLSRKRDSNCRSNGLIEKAKGVDIELAVSMLTYAQKDFYGTCHLYTSDVDFAPVIEAVRAMGKRVHVFGFENGLAKKSPLKYLPGQFINLTEILKNDYLTLPK